MKLTSEERIGAAVLELTVLLRENGHAIDESDDRALLANVLRKHFATADHRNEPLLRVANDLQ